MHKVQKEVMSKNKIMKNTQITMKYSFSLEGTLTYAVHLHKTTTLEGGRARACLCLLHFSYITMLGFSNKHDSTTALCSFPDTIKSLCNN